MSSASHSQLPSWGSTDGIAYIHTAPLLQGKPVGLQSAASQLKSPFLSPAIQAQPLLAPKQEHQQQQNHQQHQPHQHVHQQPLHLQQQPQPQQQQQQLSPSVQQAPSSSQQHMFMQRGASSPSRLQQQQQHQQMPMILEHASNPSISPSHTGQCSDDDEDVSDDDDDDDDAASTSSYSSPSASTAANTSSSSFRTFAQTSSEQPHDLHPGASHQMPGAPPSAPAGAGSSGALQPTGKKGHRAGTGGLNKSRFRGVSYDKKKRKWRVQIKVATLGKSGVSVGYYDTESNAARAYDRAAIGLLGRDNCSINTNFPLQDYDQEIVPQLIGKTREEVKTTLKNERAKIPRRRFSSRQRTSRFMGVGSSNRKNQWQARILVHGKVTHLGYYETEEEAARVYDRVSISLHGPAAHTNFPLLEYQTNNPAEYSGLEREDLQRALGVKPMDKSSKFRGVSKKKGKWEAKVMVNRKWAYRELFDSEEEAARAYDGAVWRLKPKEAKSYVNFKDPPGQASTKLAKAARAIERAQAKERVGSSQSSPSSCRSLPPLPPAHDSLADGLLAHGFTPSHQGTISGFPVGIKQEPGTGGPSFTPHPTLSRAAQSAAVANLGATPPAGSPGSLSRTSSSHVGPVGLLKGRAGHPPAWLSQPLTAPMASPPQKRGVALTSEPVHFSSPARSSFQNQPHAMPAGLPPHGMIRTLSEADISHQSAMSALSNAPEHHHDMPPSSSTRQLFHMQTMPGAHPPSSHLPPMSPQKRLKTSMSYQDLSSNSFKLGSPPTLQSRLSFMPAHLQQPQQAQHAQQGQQAQSNSMMVRVGSETHFIPESQGMFFGMSRIPSAKYMQLMDQRSSQTVAPNILQELQLQGEDSGAMSGLHAGIPIGPPIGNPFAHWSHDSQHLPSSGATDMQVDSRAHPPMQQLSANLSDLSSAHFSVPYMESQLSSYPPPQLHFQPNMFTQPGSMQQGPPSPYMGPPQGGASSTAEQQTPHTPYFLQPSHHHYHQQQQHELQAGLSGREQQQQQQQQQLQSQFSAHEQHEQQQATMHEQHQQHQQQQSWQQGSMHEQQQQPQQQQPQQQQQQPQQQQQQQQHQERQQGGMLHFQNPFQVHAQGAHQMPQQGPGPGLPRSASVSQLNMGMPWQAAPASVSRCASTSNLIMPGQEWLSQEDMQGAYGGGLASGQLQQAGAAMQAGQQGTSAIQTTFEGPGGPHPGDATHTHISSADLLADLTASQLLAQADMADCSSPLKIVQIGGDDLFENDEAAGNDYLLDTEAGLSPYV